MGRDKNDPNRRVEHLAIQPRLSMTPIIDRLYIGDVHLAAKVLSTDHHMGISHVLSLFSSSVLSSFCNVISTVTIPTPSGPPVIAQLEVAKRGSTLVRMAVPLRDNPEQPILHVLQPCFEFIDESRLSGAALVHCMAGVSRSAAIVTAYLMRTLKLTLKEALGLLKIKYKKASPNPGFLQQLLLFEKMLFSEEGIEDLENVRSKGVESED